MFKSGLVVFVAVMLISLFGALFYVAIQPKPFIWTESYNRFSKQPFGLYIFHSELKNLFREHTIRGTKESDFEQYFLAEINDQEEYDEDGKFNLVVDSAAYFIELPYSPEFNFIAVDQYVHFDNEYAKALLLHLYQGNHALISAYSTSEILLKMLDLKISVENSYQEGRQDSTVQTIIRATNDSEVILRSEDTYAPIIKYPPDAKVVLVSDREDVVSVRIPVGEGSITICTAPILFTNYYLLNSDRRITEDLLFELPERDTFWANRLVFQPTYPEKRSILDFIHANPPLAWAFYTLIFGGLLYLLFLLRRKERAIPTIKPPENLSLSFIESVSSLFFLRKNNKELVRKKMNYFLEYVREQYRLDTYRINEKFLERLSKKADVPPNLINLVFRLYDECLTKPTVSDEEFLRFNKLMQTFKMK